MAAEVISLGEWLDYVPLPFFSCCGWGLVAGLAGKQGGKEEAENEQNKRKREKWERTW